MKNNFTKLLTISMMVVGISFSSNSYAVVNFCSNIMSSFMALNNYDKGKGANDNACSSVGSACEAVKSHCIKGAVPGSFSSLQPSEQSCMKQLLPFAVMQCRNLDKTTLYYKSALKNPTACW